MSGGIGPVQAWGSDFWLCRARQSGQVLPQEQDRSPCRPSDNTALLLEELPEGRDWVCSLRVIIDLRCHHPATLQTLQSLLVKSELPRIPAEIKLDPILFDHEIDPCALHPSLL